MATYYVDDGGGKAVSAATNANPCQVTVTGHGFSTNDKVVFHNVGGMTQINFTNGSAGYTVTVVDADNFTIGIDSTAYGTYTSGGTAHNGKSWGAAYTSVSALDDVFSFASGDIVYIGHDHVCQYAHTANRTITGPGSGLPTIFISATTGSSPPAYQASTTDQIDTSEGSYSLTLSGMMSAYGVCLKSGNAVTINNTSKHKDITIRPAANGQVTVSNSTLGKFAHKNLTIDLTADGTTNRSGTVINSAASRVIISGLSFINPAYRTGTVVNSGTSDSDVTIDSADFSGFTNATSCELLNGTASGRLVFKNCKTAGTWTPVSSGTPYASCDATFINCGPSDDKTYLFNKKYEGEIISSSSIYRSSGAQIEGTATSWLVTTTTTCSQDATYYSPEIYGYIGSIGSKTFDLFITNDTADFNNNEVWLEIEYLGTSSSGKWSSANDYMADRLATPAAQTDDTTSTWNGSGPSYTYKQKLSVTATVNTVGMFRARVCVGVASIASTRKFYIDPLVTVS
jgi:hypothetical protein